MTRSGGLAYEQGDHAAARFLYEESLAISRESGAHVTHCRFAPGHSRPGTQGALGDKQNIADAPGNLGNVAYEKSGYGAERVVAREACQLWEGAMERSALLGSGACLLAASFASTGL